MILAAITTISLIALIAGLALGFASRSLPPAGNDQVEQVNDLLPQTQCAQCGYPGCRPYAQAVVESGEAINLCPPGGDATVEKLATLLGREVTVHRLPALPERVSRRRHFRRPDADAYRDRIRMHRL